MKVLISDKSGLDQYMKDNEFNYCMTSKSFYEQCDSEEGFNLNENTDSLYVDVDSLTPEISDMLNDYKSFVDIHYVKIDTYINMYNSAIFKDFYNGFDSTKIKLDDDFIVSGSILINSGNPQLGLKLMKNIATQLVNRDITTQIYTLNPISSKDEVFHNCVEIVNTPNKLIDKLKFILNEINVRSNILIENEVDTYTKLEEPLEPIVFILSDLGYFTIDVLETEYSLYKSLRLVSSFMLQILSFNLDKLNITLIINTKLNISSDIYRQMHTHIITKPIDEAHKFPYEKCRLNILGSFDNCKLIDPNKINTFTEGK